MREMERLSLQGLTAIPTTQLTGPHLLHNTVLKRHHCQPEIIFAEVGLDTGGHSFTEIPVPNT